MHPLEFLPLCRLINMLSYRAYDAPAYQQQLQSKLAELQRFVETNLVQLRLRSHIMTTKKFVKGGLVWLSNPTAGKLTP